MWAPREFVSMEARLISALLTLGLLLSGCGRSDIAGATGVMSRSSTVPQSVVDIIHAIDAGDLGRLKTLLEGGAVPTPSGSPLSPIHAAITHFRNGQLICDSAALELLLLHGADPNFVDQDSGFAPLEDALSMGDLICARLLKDAGADVNRGGNSGQSILQFAVKGAVRVSDVAVLEMVLTWGVDPNVRSEPRAATALHEAVWASPGKNVVPIVAELLRSGANPCIATSSGDTPLDHAKFLNRSAALQKLLADAMSNCPS